jgi:hypothetical protein
LPCPSVIDMIKRSVLRHLETGQEHRQTRLSRHSISIYNPTGCFLVALSR